MPSTQLYNKGSDNSVFSHPVYTNVKRSRFNLSKKKFFNADVGMIMPVDLIPTLPGDDFEISCSYILETLPLVAPSMTNYKVRTHWYYIDNISLWKGWSTFITKGRSGSIDLSVPYATDGGARTKFFPLGDYYGYQDIMDFCVEYNDPMSLPVFLGLNPDSMTGNPDEDLDDNGLSTVHYPQTNYLPMSGFGSWCYVNGYSYDEQGNLVDSDGSTIISSGSSISLLKYLFEVPESNNPVQYSLLPFMFYQKIYRQNYINENLLQDNKIWFPDDITDGWRINYAADNVYFLSGAGVSNYHGFYFTPTAGIDFYSGSSICVLDGYHINLTTSSDSIYTCNSVPKVTDNVVNLLQLRYAMFENDYFTTALPWQQRGAAPTLDIDFTTSSTIDDISLTFPSTSSSSGSDAVYIGSTSSQSETDENPSTFLNVDSNGLVYLRSITSSEDGGGYYHWSLQSAQAYLDFLQSGTGSGTMSTTISQALFSLSDLRSLMALSVWQERNARTNGNYNSTIYAHFETNPKQNEFEPVYIGGTSDDVQFTRVIQTSESSSSSPLGSEAGLGSAQSNGFVGRFHCNDYGFIMGVMIISPEVSYAQEVQHFWTELSQSDFYMPEFSSLSLQPILNREIYPQGTDLTNTDDDSDLGLFGYQERYTYLKQRSNTVSGLFALPSDVDSLFSAYAQERWFDELPQLSQQFVTMSPDNLRRDWLAYPSQPAFKVQFASNIFATRPLPYQNVPATFGF